MISNISTVPKKEHRLEMMHDIGLKFMLRSFEGTARGLPVIDVERRGTTVVYQHQYSIASAKERHSKLVTYDLATCSALIACNRSRGLWLLAHVDTPIAAYNAMHNAASLIDAKEVIFYGGYRSSQGIIAIMEGYALTRRMTVTGRNTVTSGVFNRQVGVDAKSGQLFIPRNRIDSKSAEQMTAHAFSLIHGDLCDTELKYESRIPLSKILGSAARQ